MYKRQLQEILIILRKKNLIEWIDGEISHKEYKENRRNVKGIKDEMRKADINS